MKLIFVRHGNDDKNGKLTRTGKKQAKLVCADLDYENINKIYCSPTSRTIETAGIISRELKIKNVVVDNRITEREKLPNSLSQKEKDEFNANYLNPNFSRVNPEGCKEYVDRITAFLDDIIKNNSQDDTILIVGHSSMLYVVNSYIYKTPKNKDIIWTRMGNCSKICYEVWIKTIFTQC